MESKNVVFVFGDDPLPTPQEVHRMAYQPQKKIDFYAVNSHQKMMEIILSTSGIFEHFITKSAPPETLEMEPTVLGVEGPFYLHG